MLQSIHCLRAGPRLTTALLLLAALTANPVRAQPPGDKFDLEQLPKKVNRLDIQQKLAESNDPLLRQTRIDRVFFSYPQKGENPVRTLNFHGVCLAHNYRAESDNLGKKLKQIFIDLYAGPDVPNPKPFKEVANQSQIDIAQVVGIDDPNKFAVVVLQQAAAAKDLDGVLFSGVHYDKDRKLIIEGLTGHGSQTQAVADIVAEALTKNPLWGKGTDQSKPAILISMPVWDPLPLLQGDLARSDKPGDTRELFQQTLVRRVRFNYKVEDAKKPIILNCAIEAKNLKVGFQETDARQLLAQFEASCLKKLKQINDEKKPFFPLVSDGKPVARLGSEEIVGIDSPVYAVQKRLNADRALDGALAERAIYDANATLRIQGFLNDKAGHLAKLKDAVAQVVKERPDAVRLATTLPGEVFVVDDVKQYPEVLQPSFFQKRLAANPKLMQRQTRFDRVNFDYENNKLLFQLHGASLHPDWLTDAAKAAQLGKTEFTDPLMATYLRDAHKSTQPTARVDTIVRIDEDPVPRLQQTAGQDAKLDGMLFLPATYDGDALLHFPVLLVKPEQPAHRETALAAVDKERLDPRVFRPAPPGKAYAVDVKPGGPFLQTLLQEKLANSRGFKFMREVRLDRVWFGYAKLSIKQPQLRCRGVALYFEEKDKPAPKPRKEIAEKLEQDTIETWGLAKAWDEGIDLKANLDEIDMVPQPALDLQQRVARVEALDGTRLYRADDREKYSGSFNDKGKLILRGEWRDKAQKKDLCQLISDYFKVRPPRLDQNGLILQMGVYRTDRVLHDLRLHAADRLEDVLLQRVYFNDNGIVKLQGLMPDHKKDEYEKELKKEIDERLKKETINPENDENCDVGRRGVRVASARLLPGILALVPPLDEKTELDVKPVPGLTQFLRNTLQAAPAPAPNKADALPPPERWDGIWFTRGFYDPQGNYFPVGYLGDENQRKQLEVLLQELAPTKWRPQIPNSWNMERLKLMPLQAMVDRLRVVMPAYTEFDGLTLKRAFHDVTGTLVLRVSVIGTLKRTAAAKFKELLDAHPEWKERSVIGVRIQQAGRAISPEPRVVEESILESVTALKFKKIEKAMELASTAILHDPEDSTAWYLRALGFYLLGDKEQAQRDLRRTVLLEREGVRYPGPRANLRLERLELLQTKDRQILSEGRKSVLNEVEAGKPPLKLSRTP